MDRRRLTLVVSVAAAAVAVVALIVSVSFYIRNRNREPPRPLDLTGEWIQTGIEGLDYYHVASVRDGLISLYRYRPAYDDSELIWVGTYIPPRTSKDSYRWDSENRVPRNQMSIYTLRNDRLTFHYDKGLLSFDVAFNALLKMAVSLERWGTPLEPGEVVPENDLPSGIPTPPPGENPPPPVSGQNSPPLDENPPPPEQNPRTPGENLPPPAENPRIPDENPPIPG